MFSLGMMYISRIITATFESMPDEGECCHLLIVVKRAKLRAELTSRRKQMDGRIIVECSGSMMTGCSCIILEESTHCPHPAIL